MKILMINHFPLEGSGSGTYTKNLATSLVKKGHEVTIIVPENIVDYPELPGVKIRPVFFTAVGDTVGIKDYNAPEGALPFNIPCFTSHPRSTAVFGDLSEEEMELYKEAFTRAIREEVEAGRPDIIHGQHVWILPSLAVGMEVPIVLTAHGTDLMGCRKWPGLKHYAEEVMEAAQHVISISNDNCELLKEEFPGCDDKIVMMRNGFNSDVFYPDPLEATAEDKVAVLEKYGLKYNGEKIVFFAGKLANFKGVDILLRAASEYEEKEPKTITVLAGDGDEREKLFALKDELGLKTVNFIGNVTQQELRKLYSIADVSLVPSRREPFGLVAIEAMVCGAPVIATNQGGLPDFVNDSVGKLVEPEDAHDLAEGIMEVLSRKADSDEERINWRREISDYANNNYSQDAIIAELENLYSKLR